MKPFFAFFFILTAFISPKAEAGDSFTIFAPSRKSNSLLIAEAKVNGDKLTMTQKKSLDLGFAATSITQHPELPILYVSINRGEKDKCPGATIILNESGPQVVPFTFKHGYCYLSLDRTNKYLFGCSYGDGTVDVYSLDSEGKIDNHVTGLDEGRKTAHCVLPSPDNKFVYIPYVKDNNALFQYAFDETNGSLTALDPLNAMPPEGTGPRHMAYHPSQPFVYFSNEQGIGVSVYTKLESGQLKIKQVCEAVEAGTDKNGLSSSDIVITPDGKYLFAGIRGAKKNFDRISRYQIQPDGTVKLLGLINSDPIPWGLSLSPNADFLIATSFKGGTLLAFKIGKDGDLTPQPSLKWDENVSDVICR